MRKIITFLDSLSKPVVFVMALLLVVLVAVFDFAIGLEYSLSFFYLFPVSLATWPIGRRAGVLVAFICAVFWIGANFLAGGYYSSSLVLYWNVAVRFSFLVVVTFLLAALRRAYEHQKTLARTDYLTGILNRRAFYETAEIELARSKRFKHPLTMVYIDLDHFKEVNDRWGHATGDFALQRITAVLVSNVRSVDIVARLGGDEFALLLLETGQSGAAIVLSRMQEKLNAEMQVRGWAVGFSYGVLVYSTPPDTVEQMLHMADLLMYEAKQDQDNSVKFVVN
ncbi:MAG: GGDEF domain-containing protein [Chloroflexota bacterium]